MFLIPSLLILAVALMAAGCRDDDDATPAATATPTAETSPPVSTATPSPATISTPDATAGIMPTPPELPHITSFFRGFFRELAIARPAELEGGTATKPDGSDGAEYYTTALDTACPTEQSACDFASLLNGWVRTADIDAIIGASEPTIFICPRPTPMGIGYLDSLCEGASAGESRAGYRYEMQESEGSVLNEKDLRNEIKSWIESDDPSKSDDYGSGQVRFASIGCPRPEPAADPSCESHFSVVFTKITVTWREFLTFRVEGG